MNSRFQWANVVLVSSALAACLVTAQPAIAIAVIIAAAAIAVAPFLKWLRFDVDRPRSRLPAPELVALPLVIEGQVFYGQNGTLVLVAALLFYLKTIRPNRAGPSFVVLGAIAVIFVLPYSRPLDGALLPGALIPAGCIAVVVMSARRRDAHTAISSLLDGIGLYLLANVAAYLAGVESPASVARIGGLDSGGEGLRVIFPIASSLATPAAVAAMYFAAAVICFERCSLVRLLFRIAALLSAAFILVAADTRAALITAVVVFTIAIVSTRLLARLAAPLVAVSAAFGFIFELIQRPVTNTIAAVSSAVPTLSRGDEAGDLTLNFRSVIWHRSLEFWGNAVGPAGQLLGFGARGQERSGASSLYANNLAGVSANPQSASVHNSYIQNLYDAGLVGVAVLVVLMLWAARRYSGLLRDRAAGAQLALPALLAAAVTGVTEVALAPSFMQVPVFLLVGLVIFASAAPPPAGLRLAKPKRGAKDTVAVRDRWKMLIE